MSINLNGQPIIDPFDVFEINPIEERFDDLNPSQDGHVLSSTLTDLVDDFFSSSNLAVNPAPASDMGMSVTDNTTLAEYQNLPIKPTASKRDASVDIGTKNPSIINKKRKHGKKKQVAQPTSMEWRFLELRKDLIPTAGCETEMIPTQNITGDVIYSAFEMKYADPALTWNQIAAQLKVLTSDQMVEYPLVVKACLEYEHKNAKEMPDDQLEKLCDDHHLVISSEFIKLWLLPSARAHQEIYITPRTTSYCRAQTAEESQKIAEKKQQELGEKRQKNTEEKQKKPDEKQKVNEIFFTKLESSLKKSYSAQNNTLEEIAEEYHLNLDAFNLYRLAITNCLKWEKDNKGTIANLDRIQEICRKSGKFIIAAFVEKLLPEARLHQSTYFPKPSKISVKTNPAQSTSSSQNHSSKKRKKKGTQST